MYQGNCIFRKEGDNMALKRMAQAVLADYGIKMYQKNMKQVTLIKRNIRDYIAHVRLFTIRTHEDRVLIVKQVTVNENNKFSMNSARYHTMYVIEL